MAHTSAAPGRRIGAQALVVAAISTIAAVVVLQAWNADLSVPFEYGGDTNFYAATAKTIDEHGWYFEDPDLGWPLGSQLYDLPSGGDNLQFAAVKVLTLVTGWPQALNVYFLFTFPLIAVSAFLVARRFVGFPAGTAAALALLYAFLPYHFARGQSHLFLANYAVVPIAAALILRVMQRGGEPIWAFVARGRRRGLLLTGLACVVVGSTATYYTVFAGLLIAAVGLLVATHSRDWRPAAWGFGVAATLAAVMVINLVPSLVYWQRHGANDVGNRPIKDSEQFGLRMSQLLLPTNDHRVGRLATAAEKARVEVAAPTEHGSALGVAGDIGFVAAVGSALGIATRRRSTRHHPEASEVAASFASSMTSAHGSDAGDDEALPEDPSRPGDLASLGAATLVALLFGLSGGLGHLVALFGFTYIRGWNRISVFIAFFALLALGHVIEAIRRWVGPRLGRRGPGTLSAALALLVILGLLDQSPVHPFPRPYRAVERTYRADAALVRDVEQRFGADAAMFQMPIVRYPEEGPVQRMADYDHFRGYLHSETLRWSYGAMRGREGAWLEELSNLPPAAQVTAMVAVGFDGIWLNRTGFADAGESFEAAAAPLTGPFRHDRPTDIDIADLRPLAGRARAELGSDTMTAIKDQVLRPIRSAGTEGWLPFESEAGHTIRWAHASAVLELTNPTDAERDALVRFAVERHRSAITITWPGGSRTLQGSADEPDAAELVSIDLSLPPGATAVEFHADGREFELPDGRRVAFRIRDPLVTDALVIESAGRLVSGA